MIIYYGKVTDDADCYVFAVYVGGERVGALTAHEDHLGEIKHAMRGAEFIHQPRDPDDWFHLGPPLTPEERAMMEYDLDRLGP